MAKARQQYFADEQTLAKTDKEFAIENSLVEKINSIEEGAQVNTIETVKVNGVALEPDENKAVDISVPLVEDNLFSIDPDSALSANQGRILWENVHNLQSRGRYLSNWNCDTGLPVTNPTDNPYRYRSGDYYIVSVVAPAGGGHNYRPDGDVYIHNQSSSVVEDVEVHVGDMYLYDGTNWLLIISTERPIAIDSSLSLSSTNPVENRVVTTALNAKQDTISDLATIRAGAAAGATAVQPGDRIDVLSGTSDNITEGVEQLFLRATDRTKLNYLTGVNTGDETWETITRKLGRADATRDGYLSHEDFITFSQKQGALTAGDNIDITNNVISATYTAGDNIDITNGEISATYTAGTGIDITNGVISNTKEGEWGEITGTLSNQTDLQTALDGKVNLGNNQVYDNTVVEIGKWEHGQSVDTSGHHVTLDPNGELSTYNVTVAGHNEATLGSGTLELLSNTALGGDETLTLDHEKLVVDDGTNSKTYNFYGNDRVATLSDVSGAASAAVSDNPYTSSWDGVTTIAPSKNAVYDKLNAMDTTIAGKQDTLTAGRDITINNNTINADVDVDVVRVSTLSDQEAEDLFLDLHYHIILYNDDIYLYEKTTTMGGDVFTITNHYLSVDTFESVGTSNSTLYKKTLEVSSWGEGHFYMTAGTVNISNVLSTSDTYTTAYTPTQDYNPATKKYVDDGLNSRIVVSSSTPSNPSEGLIWYDSTNDLLKVYDGTNWNVTGKTYTAGTGINISNQDVITADTTVLATQTDLAGKANVADVNTKTFYPINDTTDTATVQAIIEWIESGKNAIVRWDGKSYSFSHTESSSGGLTTLYYFNHTYVKQDNATIGDLTNDTLWMWYDSRYGYSTLSTYTYNSTYIPRDNTIQYTPTGDYNPATKKYVDDSISGIVFPTYTAGDGIDIDANNEVSVDASDLAGTGLTTSNNNLDVDTTVIQAKLTAGTGIDITSDTISADTTVLATKTDLSSKANASDLNTKTFPMAVATKVADAQAAIDWVLSGKNALINLDNRIYLLDKVESGVYYFKAVAYSNNGTNDTMTVTNIEVTVSSGTVTEVHIMGEAHGYLETNRNYGTPFVPTQAGHPATKKYVDDSISGIVIPAYTAGTGLTLNNYEFAADTTVLATKADIANLGSFTVVDTLPSASSASEKTIYLLGPIGSGADKYEEWIVTNQPNSETFTGQPVGSHNFYYTPGQLSLSETTTLTYISSTGGGNGDRGFCLEDTPYYGYFEGGVVGPDDGWYEYNGSTWDFVDSTSITVASGTYNLDCGPGDYDFDTIVISTGTTKAWTKIGETSVDLTNYFNTSTQTSDAITEGSTNLFLTSAERTILGNTSNTNTGDETKTTIQTKLGAATSSNSGYLSSTDWSTFNSKQNALTAGDGIDITNNVISADGLQEELTAGNNITIQEVCESDMQGPCPSGFHVPTHTEWMDIYGILTTTFSLDRNADTMVTYLKMPKAGFRSFAHGNTGDVGYGGRYWSSLSSDGDNAYYLSFDPSSINIYAQSTASASSIRCLKNSPVIPDNSWTTLYDGSSVATGAGVFYNLSLGLISVSGDGNTWYTIQDKNLGATTVYNDGDTLSEANCGKYYQWGNNYGFAGIGGTVTTGNDKVDASGYGPGNYYSDNIFIISSDGRSSVQNENLWGGVSQGTRCYNEISATDTTYTAGDNISISNGAISADVNTKSFYLPNDLTSASALSIAQDAYDWFNAGKTPIIVYKGKTCTVAYSTASGLAFRNARTLIDNTTYSSSGCTAIVQYEVYFAISSGTVTDIIKTEPESYFIDTTTQYTNPFNPTQNYHPATKKYVDDIKPTSGSTAPSTTPTFVGQQYVDTTNDKMYVATGTSSSSDWMEVGAGSGDMLYADFNWVTKTGATITLDLASSITPSANFTVNAPATIKDGQAYVLRVTQGATAYTMTLGTNVTNPYSESLVMEANSINQFTFLAIGGNLELQPSVTPSGGGTWGSITGTLSDQTDLNTALGAKADATDVLTKTNTTSYTPSANYHPATKKYVDDSITALGAITVNTTGTSSSISKLWVGTEAEYQQLQTYDSDTAYMTY